jgi:lysophospholipase L1-like esterase
MRTFQTLAVLVLAFAAMAFAARPAIGDPTMISKTSPLRIMALGDSITAGVGAFGRNPEDGGYRGPLEQQLEASGYHVTFVGSRSDFAKTIHGRDHEGWPGYVVRSFPSDPGPGQLYGSLARKAIQQADPDVVLLMAGTNDLLRHEGGAAGYTLPNILQSMKLLLDEIVTTKPGVFVILAPVVESPKVNDCAVRDFDDGALSVPGCTALTPGLKTLAKEYAQRGYHVSFAGAMETAVPRDTLHFPDGIHPAGPGGYAAIASVWMHAIESITAPQTGQPVAQMSRLSP